MVQDPAAWQAFDDELARWREQGRTLRFWWRDDDAHRADPALSRLITLAHHHAVPLALAVIPDRIAPDLPGAGDPLVELLQHGVDHQNRALAGQKKSEFPPHEPMDEALSRLRRGGELLEALAAPQAGPGHTVLPVLVPPWNRLAFAELWPRLTSIGLRGISTFGPRKPAQAQPGLVQVNTHVDIIDWHGSRGFAGEAAVLGQAVQHLQARRTGQVDADEATGWLTHHAVHDMACWDFLARLFEATQRRGGAQWCTARSLFAG